MKVSLSWLRQYVSVEMDAKDLCDALTMSGLEVDSVYDRYEYLNNVIVGRITEISPHPKAQKLRLCNVEAGDKIYSVVCGAPNVVKDMKAPLALPGTILPDGTVLQKTVIRGEMSEGMLCSETELGLGTDSSGIMVLDSTLPTGQPLPAALKLADPVFDIDLTPNRSDCLSVIGIAREAAAIQKTRLNYPDMTLPAPKGDINTMSSVIINAPEHCPRYAARILENVTIGPSPFWLQDRLLSVGMRPINNIVDITNFVMMEMGQPLHAFDLDRLAENRIVVRTANPGELFTTLDRKERALSENMLLICDGQKPVAVAGVMGGLNSEIEPETRRVLLESACFNPSSIRITAKKLGLNTEASHRFERGVDPEGTLTAVNRAAQLIADIAGATLIDGIIDQHPIKTDTKKISLGVEQTNSTLGLNLQQDTIRQLLMSIGFEVEADTNETLCVTVPPFRVDVSRPVDLIEEVARLAGYDTIPVTFPLIPAGQRKPSRLFDFRFKIRQLMTGFGFYEAINYSFIAKNSCDLMNLPDKDPRRNQIVILNPLSEDQAVMRSSLLPGLLETARRNMAQQVKNLKLFEVGKIFITTGAEELPEETEMVAALWTGANNASCWHSKETPCDFYDIKGAAESLLNALGLTGYRFTAVANSECFYTKPGYTAQILLGDTAIGLVGEIHSDVARNYNLKQNVYIFELDTARLADAIPATVKSEPIPKFPSVSRDITLIVSNDIEAQKVLDTVENMNEELIEDILLFDMYAGDPIPAGKKSLSLRIIFRSFEETLEDRIVNQIHKSISDKLLAAFDATLPTSC